MPVYLCKQPGDVAALEVLRELANSVGGGAVGNTSGSSIFGTSGAQKPSGPYHHTLPTAGAVKGGLEPLQEGDQEPDALDSPMSTH